MTNNYQFIDAYGSVQTAASSVVNGAHQQIVQISSTVSIPVVFSGSPSISGAVTIVGTPSISGAVTLAGGYSSVSGVGVFNFNNIGNGSILAIIPGSVATAPSPASVSGVGIFNVNHTGNGSILVGIPGSVATVPSPASVSGVGIFNTNPTGNGSVITLFSKSPSIVGTYPEDTTHTDGNPGLFTLGVRNDTTASFVSANSDYTPIATDSTGRILTKPFASGASSIFGTGSVNGAASVIVIGAPGAGLRNYITDIFIANTGSVASLVRFTAGGASVLGYTIAPANSGSNIIGMQTPIATQVNSPFNIAADTASSVIYGTAYGFVAP